MPKALLAVPVAIGVAAGAFLGLYATPAEPGLLTRSALTLGGSPVLGDPGAPITILEWGDYQCTYCYRFHQDTLGVIMRDYVETGKARLVFKDFPLNGPDSVQAAAASHCAGDQGRYWEYHDILYENWGGERTGWITRDALAGFAGTVGLDAAEFADCMDEERHVGRVEGLYASGSGMGIDATPSFLIYDGEQVIKVRGNQPLGVFVGVLDGLAGSQG